MEHEIMRILFDSKDKKFKSVFGTLRESEGCRFNIHIPKTCKTKQVNLVFKKEDGALFSSYFMEKTDVSADYDVYSCDVCFAKSGLFFYYFFITTENETFSLYKQGYDMTNMEDGSLWQLSVIPKSFKVPSFYKGNIMYQIFPDRFNSSGEFHTDGKLEPFIIRSGFRGVPWFKPDEKGIVQNNDFFGGDLKGITEKLDHIASLNVGVIYLNPIFKAYSNHRYDTADYKKIDELLGNEDDFKKLCEEAHKRGIRIILDGVFSHTGSNSIYFDSENIFGNGALSNENSPYRSWFDFKKYPDEYTSWWGIKTLPCVDENNESYRDYIIRDEDSVAAHWLKLGADGFRLDVADELPDSFILELRERMKGLKPDSFLVGEVWEDASNKCSYSVRRKYFTDGELDSVMNYPFRNAIIDFVSGKDKGQGIRDTVMTVAENYPTDVLNCLMNSLSTHDTARILTVLGVEDVPGEKQERARYQMSPEQLDNAKDMLFCATFLQFVLPGMPCIFYGDEIGTEGFEDPFCRSCFDWERVDRNIILDFYRKMSFIKKNSDVLKEGDVSVFVVADGIIKIERNFSGKKAIAYINTADEDFVLEKTSNVVFSNRAFCDGNKKFTKKFGFVLCFD